MYYTQATCHFFGNYYKAIDFPITQAKLIQLEVNLA